MNNMKIAVAGASGRMGQMLVEAILAADDATLSGALDIPSSPAIGNAIRPTAPAARPSFSRCSA